MDEATIWARARAIRAQKEAIAARTGRHVERVFCDELELDWDWRPATQEQSAVPPVPVEAIREVLRRIGWDAGVRAVARELGITSGRQINKIGVTLARLRSGQLPTEPTRGRSAR